MNVCEPITPGRTRTPSDLKYLLDERAAAAGELASAVLPHFKANVLRGWPRTYGHYAEAIGRDPAKESMVVGKAMHVIGAACVMARVPVAPIHYVTRADGDWRGIFERSASEARHVLPLWDCLAVSSRIYKYADEDFALVTKVIDRLIPKHFDISWQSPSKIWQYLIYVKASDGVTWVERAAARYQQIIADERHSRAVPKLINRPKPAL